MKYVSTGSTAGAVNFPQASCQALTSGCCLTHHLDAASFAADRVSVIRVSLARSASGCQDRSAVRLPMQGCLLAADGLPHPARLAPHPQRAPERAGGAEERQQHHCRPQRQHQSAGAHSKRVVAARAPCHVSEGMHSTGCLYWSAPEHACISGKAHSGSSSPDITALGQAQAWCHHMTSLHMEHCRNAGPHPVGTALCDNQRQWMPYHGPRT